MSNRSHRFQPFASNDLQGRASIGQGAVVWSGRVSPIALTLSLLCFACDRHHSASDGNAGGASGAGSPAGGGGDEAGAGGASPIPGSCSVPVANGAPSPVVGCQEAPPPTSSPVIDDFEDGDFCISTLDRRMGSWFTYTDGTSGRVDATIVDTDDGKVLHLSGGGFSVWGPGFGALLSWSPELQGACLYDASDYGGLRFRARGNANLRAMIATQATTYESLGGGCPDSQDCYDQHGRTLELSSTWQDYELDFCELFPAGWGGQKPSFDPATLVMLNFSVQNLQDFELWLDDVEFVESSEPGEHRCGPSCPSAEVPVGVQPEPTETSITLSENLSLFTFEQPTTNCGALTRRYLVYVPDGLGEASDAPVLFVLHGSGSDAESMRDFMTQRRFETLADRDGFVVIYGNAAPGVLTSAQFPNGGAWRIDPASEVNDREYLTLVLQDLAGRAVLSGDNPIFLSGISNGGSMVMSAVLEAPERYRGFAAVMPYTDPILPRPEPSSAMALERVLIAYTPDDPGLPSGAEALTAPLPPLWAAAMAIPGSAIAAPVRTELPNTVSEGADYTGDLPAVLRTRNSSVAQIDYGSIATGPAVRVLEFDHAGHLWPVPEHTDPERVLSEWGLRNQDIDGANAIWEFFASSL